MTYPRTLRLTPDGVVIVVQRHTARAVATAALGVVGHLTIADAHALCLLWPGVRGNYLPLVVALADCIAASLDMDDAMIASARDLAGRKGIPRG